MGSEYWLALHWTGHAARQDDVECAAGVAVAVFESAGRATRSKQLDLCYHFVGCTGPRLVLSVTATVSVWI
jgi:hypothetical protein